MSLPVRKTFFNFPSRSDRFDHLGKRGTHWDKDEVIGFHARIVKATADQQEVLSIIFPLMQHGHHRPIKEPRPFGALTHRDPLPILGLKRECLGHRRAFAAFAGLYPHRFIAGHCQPVEVLVRF